MKEKGFPVIARGSPMPTYEFRCSACGKTFAVTMRVADFDRSKIKCPRCGKKDINQVFSNFSVNTSRKS